MHNRAIDGRVARAARPACAVVRPAIETNSVLTLALRGARRHASAACMPGALVRCGAQGYRELEALPLVAPDKERTIAGPGFNRWLVPPAALAIHLCIGMAYGFSVFWLPLSKAIGIKESLACPADMGFMAEIFRPPATGRSRCWAGCSRCSSSSWAWPPRCSAAGSSTPARARPASCRHCAGAAAWSSRPGHLHHQIWLMWLGSGVIGGIGLGLGYISPVSTLIKWFPDRRGMATGMAIMGFGGGAMIGAPLADKLMKHFATPTSVGVWETFLALAAIYFVFMMAGALSYRVPANGWKPEGWTPPAAKSGNTMITNAPRAREPRLGHSRSSGWCGWCCS
jgi:MFS family permease